MYPDNLGTQAKIGGFGGYLMGYDFRNMHNIVQQIFNNLLYLCICFICQYFSTIPIERG